MENIDTSTLHPSIAHFFNEGYFDYKHLPPALQTVSAPFGKLAKDIAFGVWEDNEDGEICVFPKLTGPEATVALRKLLEAKDAAVRSAKKLMSTRI